MAFLDSRPSGMGFKFAQIILRVAFGRISGVSVSSRRLVYWWLFGEQAGSRWWVFAESFIGGLLRLWVRLKSFTRAELAGVNCRIPRIVSKTRLPPGLCAE